MGLSMQILVSDQTTAEEREKWDMFPEKITMHIKLHFSISHF